LRLNILRTADFTNPAPMTVLASIFRNGRTVIFVHAC
jgi:hypothetical protein